ncbi:uncharacterized protein LOC132564023 [Ylistrum balloti]|uniref:uncharacterized protein LOC132564023 n=1 Tax=Ylistrum balloti TaxID=509963 RepID=UPI002905C52E|nr:uncharacterized protein LOC132564023 [Ylistrum balloti]
MTVATLLVTDGKSSMDDSMDVCSTKLVSNNTGLSAVRRICSHKICCIILLVPLILQLYLLVCTIKQLDKASDSDSKACFKSANSIWMPYKHDRKQDHTDVTRFSCFAFDHRLSYLIDFLVAANKSTNYIPDQTESADRVWPKYTRPTTQILHFRGLEGSRRQSQEFRQKLNDKNGVSVLENGHVEINEDGIYHIYGIVTFVRTEGNAKPLKDEYRLYRKRQENRTVLLSEIVGQIQYGHIDSYKTLDLSGNFELMKGDILFPVIKNISSVYAFTAANYWGVYQVINHRDILYDKHYNHQSH